MDTRRGISTKEAMYVSCGDMSNVRKDDLGGMRPACGRGAPWRSCLAMVRWASDGVEIFWRGRLLRQAVWAVIEAMRRRDMDEVRRRIATRAEAGGGVRA